MFKAGAKQFGKTRLGAESCGWLLLKTSVKNPSLSINWRPSVYGTKYIYLAD
jgi:hypothetical protein